MRYVKPNRMNEKIGKKCKKKKRKISIDKKIKAYEKPHTKATKKKILI